jgi:hypothetical protein
VFNKVDILSVSIVLVSVPLELALRAHVSAGQAYAIAVLRLLRFARVVRLVRAFRLMMSTMRQLARPVLCFLALLLSVFYVFAVLGVQLFGGTLSPANPAVASSAYGIKNFYVLSFDNMRIAFATLFDQLVGNCWPIIVEAICASLGSRWPRVYFVLFRVVAVFIIANIVTAFIVDGYFVMYEQAKAAESKQRAGRGQPQEPSIGASSLATRRRMADRGLLSVYSAMFE